jgi:hypothetical protein
VPRAGAQIGWSRPWGQVTQLQEGVHDWIWLAIVYAGLYVHDVPVMPGTRQEEIELD